MNYYVLKGTLNIDFNVIDTFDVDGKKNGDNVEMQLSAKKLHDFKVIEDTIEKLEIDFMYENKKCTIEIYNVEDDLNGFNDFVYEDCIAYNEYQLYFRELNVFKGCDEYIAFNDENHIKTGEIEYIDSKIVDEIKKEIIEYIKEIKK